MKTIHFPSGARADPKNPQRPHNPAGPANSAPQIGVLCGPVLAATGLALPLTAKEKERLELCESVLQRGLRTFFEVGNALLTIREQQLFRAAHPTFESYCQQRWGICRSYAWRVMGAAERIRLLPSDGDMPKPANEFQMRPFLKLDPKEFPSGWEKVITRAKDGKVTPSLVREVVGELLPNGGPPGRISKPARSRSPNGGGQLGQILILLAEAKRSAEKGATEQVLDALERIENLLFGPQPSK